MSDVLFGFVEMLLQSIAERNLRISLGAHKKGAPAEGPGHQGSGWMIGFIADVVMLRSRS
jgi:hypothetical protein